MLRFHILLGLFLLQIPLSGLPQNKISNKSLITGLEVILTLVHGITFAKKNLYYAYRNMTSNNNDNNFCPALPPVGITEPYKIEKKYFFQK